MALESRASSVTTRLSSPFLVRFTDRPVAQITSPAPAHTHTPPRLSADPYSANRPQHGRLSGSCRGPVRVDCSPPSTSRLAADSASTPPTDAAESNSLQRREWPDSEPAAQSG